MNKNLFISILTLLYLSLTTHQVFGQLVDYEQPASWVKWKQIKQPNFQLIFPTGFEKSASTLAHQLDSMLHFASQDLQIKPRKISIILHENHIEQNGFAQLAPRKVEAFSTPSSNPDNQEWLPNLIQHELRHVVQMDKLAGRLRGPFLEQLALAFFGIHLPAWYFEGDAVSIETQFSAGGRGRLPSFFMPLRANEGSGKSYGFDKNILGSYKDITPTFYLTGYLMNSQLTNQFGYPVKDKIMEDMRRHLLRPYNFNKALKRQTGMNSHALYQASLIGLKAGLQPHKASPENVRILPNTNRYFSHYYLPQTHTDGSIYSLFQSPQHVPAFRKITGNTEEEVLKIGYQLRPYFDLSADFITWDEIRKDGRFGKQTYNIIRLLDLKSGKISQLSKKSRLYSPVIASKLNRVYAVHVDQDNVASLIYIDIFSKKQEKIVEFPAGLHLQQPALDAENKRIIAVAVSEEGTNLLEINLESGRYSLLFPWGNQQLERPIYQENDLIFKAHFNQIDNIYRYNRAENSFEQLSNSNYGAFNPSLSSSGKLTYNEYQSDGYRLAIADINSLKATQILPEFAAPALRDERISTPFRATELSDSAAYSLQKYNPLSDFFNFHSLSISTNNFENFDNYKPGIFWLANDLLNTSQLKLGYEYDLELEKSIYSAELNYLKYLPKFSARYLNRGRVGYIKPSKPEQEVGQFTYREHYYSLEMQLPFSLYRGKNNYSFGLNIGTSYQKYYDISNKNLKGFQDEILFPMNYIAYFNRNMRRSSMDLVPRWGQNISFVYRHVPFEPKQKGQLFALKSNFYFPGFFANHAFQARYNMQTNTGKFAASYEIPMISAFAHFNSPRVSNNLMLNYRLPLAYPDWALGSLAYIKRFHGYLFADYQNIHKSELAPKVYGLGLSMDFNLLRYKLPDFGVGAKLSYINDASAKQRFVPNFSFNYSY